MHGRLGIVQRANSRAESPPRRGNVAGEERPSGEEKALRKLERALATWSARGDAEPLRVWLAAELDGQPTPRRLGPQASWEALASIREVLRSDRRTLNGALEPMLQGLFQFASGFARPDGSPLFGPEGKS